MPPQMGRGQRQRTGDTDTWLYLPTERSGRDMYFCGASLRARLCKALLYSWRELGSVESKIGNSGVQCLVLKARKERVGKKCKTEWMAHVSHISVPSEA